MTKDHIIRKEQIENRLLMHGITEYHIDYLPYLEFDDQLFATPYETGCRMIILYAVAYAATNIDKVEKIKDWLKNENLSEHISSKEMDLFDGKLIDDQQLIDLSWQIECAYILGWALNIIEEAPSPTGPANDEQLQDFINNIPALGDKIDNFLRKLTYRNTVEIFDENIFHELATSYFRDLLFNGKENKSDIDRSISFLRHKSLNWIRRFMDIKEWDDTDTST